MSNLRTLNRTVYLTPKILLALFGAFIVAALVLPFSRSRAQEGSALPLNPSATNGRIVYEQSDQAAFKTFIHTINPNGSGDAIIAEGNEPAWSFDGTKIAFRCRNDFFNNNDNGYGICVMNADGTQILPIPNTKSFTTPAWSPNGKKLVATCPEKISNAVFLSICTINLDGSNLNFVAHGNNDFSQSWPVWSPDGAKIAYDSVNTNITVHTIRTVNADGSGDRQLSSDQFRFVGYAWPDWSPDGKKIAVTKISSDNSKEAIVTLNADTGAETLISPSDISFPSAQRDYVPSWSPDGTQIAYSQLVKTNTGVGEVPTISVMNADGSNRHPILTGGNNDGNKWGGIRDVLLPPTPTPTPTPSPVPSATPIPIPSPTFNLAVNYVGRLRDRVGTDDVNLNTDGFLDGTFQVTLPPETSSKQVVHLVMMDAAGHSWDTVRNDGYPIVGFSRAFDLAASLENNSDGTFANSIPVGNQGTFTAFVSDVNPGGFVNGDNTPSAFAVGSSFTFYVVFGDNTAASGTTTITTSPPPPNDNLLDVGLQPGNPGQLPSKTSGVAYGFNAEATYEPKLFGDGEPKHANVLGGKSVWYTWTPPVEGDVVFNTAKSDFDTLLAVYTTGGSGRAEEVASNDDVPGVNVTTSLIRFHATPKDQDGNPLTYLIAVDGAKGATGNIRLEWFMSSLTPDPNAPMITGICEGGDPATCDPTKPTNACTNDSDPVTPCTRFKDASGFYTLIIKGKNFLSNSQVTVDGNTLDGFDLNGNPTSGSTDFIDSQTLRAHIPPNPPLSLINLDHLEVVAKISNASTASKEGKVGVEGLLPPGPYNVAANTALLNVIELKNATIQPGATQTVCGHVDGLNKIGEETCMTFTNNQEFGATGPITVSPTWFAINAYCHAANPNNVSAFFQCTGYGNGQERLNQLINAGFAINPAQAIEKGAIEVKQTFKPTPGQLGAVASGGAAIVAQGGGNLLSPNGSNIVAAGGGNIVAQGGGNIVAQGGGNLLSPNGSNIVAQGGGNVVSHDGGTFVSHDGGSIVGRGGTLASNSKPFSNDAQEDGVAFRPSAARDLSLGSRGWFIVTSSGGKAPTVDLKQNADGTTDGTISVTFDSTSNPRIQDLQGLVFTAVANPAVVKFDSTSVSVDEGAGRATVTVKRTGDTSVPVSVDYATSDGTATIRSDYSPVFGTLNFAAGETSKEITIPLIDNGYGQPDAPAQRSFNLTIGNAIGGAILMPNVATVTINNNDASNTPTNPADNPAFFVRQHYLDFLGREPDQGGWDYWAGQLMQCGSDQPCVNSRRIGVSNAFFFELEYQQTASYVFRLYRAAYGNNQPSPNPDTSNTTEAKKLPSFATFFPDRALVVGGTGLAASQLALANSFVLRTEFQIKYPASLTGAQFVDAVLQTIKSDSGADLSSERNALINLFNSGGRGAVLYRLADDNLQTNPINNRAFIDAEYNRAFVFSQYAGYLRRDSDIGGFLFWLNQVNRFPLRSTSIQNAMVCSFITSAEYQQRFSSVVTHTNKECPQ